MTFYPKRGRLFFSALPSEFIFRVLVGQSLTALCSTSFQNLSTCGGSHSLTEAVYFALLSFLGLISSFHNFSPDFRCLFTVFFIFLKSLSGGNAVKTPYLPTITFPIISQTTKRRQAILQAFFYFVCRISPFVPVRKGSVALFIVLSLAFNIYPTV